MSDFKGKMYQIQFRLGLCPKPHWGSLPDPIAGLRGLLLRRGEGTGREKGREGTGRGGDKTPSLHAPPNPYFWICPCNYATVT